jgi:rare lipoprotein A
MATGTLEDLPRADADETRTIRLELGVFDSYENAVRVAQSFAALGAVDEEYLETGTRLTLTYLKPGVAHEDVLRLARELGLKDVIL